MKKHIHKIDHWERIPPNGGKFGLCGLGAYYEGDRRWMPICQCGKFNSGKSLKYKPKK